ncbi:MAG: glycosyltransferase family 2 protein [Elusimicrobia bacterium]|nr:glycosyltransferase family 2 protein [Elusimicrobiota bacterium]
MPVYNEKGSLAAVLERVLALPLDKEVIVVDDGSTDGTAEFLKGAFEGRPGLRILYQTPNQGKGAALAAGFAAATGFAVAVQDADLELDPADLPAVAAPVLDGRAAACYGSRFLQGRGRAAPASYWANRLLTSLTNLLHGSSLTDMETCYKCVRLDVLRSLKLAARRFDIEPEVTAKLLRHGHGIMEVPVRYQPRSKSEGKKIGWRDGLSALKAVVKHRFAPL